VETSRGPAAARMCETAQSHTLPVPDVRFVAGAPEKPGVYECVQQGVAHPRVQGPQILELWFRQMQARNLGVSARINCSQSAIVDTPVSPTACPFTRSEALSPDDRGVWVSSASSDCMATTLLGAVHCRSKGGR
jgi:hypothetical protein